MRHTAKKCEIIGCPKCKARNEPVNLSFAKSGPVLEPLNEVTRQFINDLAKMAGPGFENYFVIDTGEYLVSAVKLRNQKPAEGGEVTSGE